MYNFIDVTEVSESVVLPSEALSINGEYIENLISGYRTLNVSGREALSPDVETYSTGIRDGSKIKSKKYPERIIVVTYQLKAESNEAFREVYNKLGKILDVKDAELIFNDEQDKFFVGTPCVIGSVKPGLNAVVGEFEIVCADPFKYSVTEYEAEPDLDESSVLIDYGGTYKAFPTLVSEFFKEEDTTEDGETSVSLTGSGDCGYVAFFNEDRKIIQLGDPGEVDGKDAYAKSQTLVSNSFTRSSGWGSDAKSKWKLNSGVATAELGTQTGNVAMAVSTHTEPKAPRTTQGTLLEVQSKANAPIIHYKVTAKAQNRTANSVDVIVSVKTWLDKDASYFGKGYGLIGRVYIGGAWRPVSIKTTSEYWRGKSGHTKSFTYIYRGLSASQTKLTGIKFKVERTDSLGTAGILAETACKDLTISNFETAEPDTYFLSPSSYGSGSGWHGPVITRTIPADASGEVGASNFTLSFKQLMCIGEKVGSGKEIGLFQVDVTDESGKTIAGYRIGKVNWGDTGTITYYVNGKDVKRETIGLEHNNIYVGGLDHTEPECKITKAGTNVTFAIGMPRTRSFRDDSIAGLKATKITFTFMQFSSNPALTYNGLYHVKFVKNNCETWKDIPNKFSANDIVEADCKDGKIYLNGIPTPSLGALGNDWEDFCLRPGLNQIGFSYSEWVDADSAPVMKVRYREVFL